MAHHHKQQACNFKIIGHEKISNIIGNSGDRFCFKKPRSSLRRCAYDEPMV